MYGGRLVVNTHVGGAAPVFRLSTDDARSVTRTENSVYQTDTTRGMARVVLHMDADTLYLCTLMAHGDPVADVRRVSRMKVRDAVDFVILHGGTAVCKRILVFMVLHVDDEMTASLLAAVASPVFDVTRIAWGVLDQLGVDRCKEVRASVRRLLHAVGTAYSVRMQAARNVVATLRKWMEAYARDNGRLVP